MKRILLYLFFCLSLSSFLLCTKNNKYLDISYANSKYFLTDLEKKRVLPIANKLFSEGIASNKSKNYKDAITKFEQALEYYSPPEYYYNYGNSLANIGDYHNSIKAYNISIDLNYNEKYYSLYNIACSYSLLNNYEKAYEYLKLSILNGYPHFNHITKDNDLTHLRNQSNWPTIYQTIQKLYNDGNSIYFDNKKIINSVASIENIYYFFNNGKVIVHYSISEDKNHYKIGSYNISNYKINLLWFKEFGSKGIGKPIHCAATCVYEKYENYNKDIKHQEILYLNDIKNDNLNHWKIDNHNESYDSLSTQPTAQN